MVTKYRVNGGSSVWLTTRLPFLWRIAFHIGVNVQESMTHKLAVITSLEGDCCLECLLIRLSLCIRDLGERDPKVLLCMGVHRAEREWESGPPVAAWTESPCKLICQERSDTIDIPVKSQEEADYSSWLAQL